MNKDKEIWRNIVGYGIYDKYYQVSNFGRIRSLDKYVRKGNGIRLIKGRILKIGYCGNYPSVQLSDKQKVKNVPIHRLVASAFIPNSDNLPCINHIDCNPENNNVENLEWCTYKYNNDYDNRVLKCKNVRPVYVYKYDTNEFIGKYESFSEAGRHLNCRRNTISEVVSGKHKHHHGYIFTLEPLEMK